MGDEREQDHVGRRGFLRATRQQRSLRRRGAVAHGAECLCGGRHHL